MPVIPMFAVQDALAGVFHPPFVAPSEGVALRHLRDTLRMPDHPYSRHPSDYILWEVGTYDEVSAAVQPVTPRSICQLSVLLTSET